MLTAAENETLCRVEGDAPMGRLMRRHWVPALLSEQVAALTEVRPAAAATGGSERDRGQHRSIEVKQVDKRLMEVDSRWLSPLHSRSCGSVGSSGSRGVHSATCRQPHARGQERAGVGMWYK